MECRAPPRPLRRDLLLRGVLRPGAPLRWHSQAQRVGGVRRSGAAMAGGRLGPGTRAAGPEAPFCCF
eukprot:666894-Prorocentrum_lima.AAC.1